MVELSERCHLRLYGRRAARPECENRRPPAKKKARRNPGGESQRAKDEAWGRTSRDKTFKMKNGSSFQKSYSFVVMSGPGQTESASRTYGSSSPFCPSVSAGDGVSSSRRIKVSRMTSSLTDHLLSPIEQPRCIRCRTRMDLTNIVPRPDRSEKRTFECSKCAYIETKIASDPLCSEQIDRLTTSIRPPA
jgi:hypothetical protein